MNDEQLKELVKVLTSSVGGQLGDNVGFVGLVVVDDGESFRVGIGSTLDREPTMQILEDAAGAARLFGIDAGSMQ